MPQHLVQDSVEPSDSLWRKAARKFFSDSLGIFSLSIVSLYFLVAVGVWLGWWGTGWEELITDEREGVSAAHWFGTNINGQDVFARAVYSTRTAFEVGFVVAVLATFVGAIAGCVSGYFSGTFIDEFITFLYGCLDSIPFYLFVAAIAVALQENPFAMHIAMISTFWTSTGRVVRGGVIKLRNLEFVEAARAIGVKKIKIIFAHIMPNTTHILLVQATIAFVAAIKSEVILSFLGLGVKEGVSWGLMLSESSFEVGSGIFNNFLAASGFMFVLVMAFNQFADALQDALDPKKVG